MINRTFTSAFLNVNNSGKHFNSKTFFMCDNSKSYLDSRYSIMISISVKLFSLTATAVKHILEVKCKNNISENWHIVYKSEGLLSMFSLN